MFKSASRTIALTLSLYAMQPFAALQASETRQLYVISDTHLGLGRLDGAGDWSSREWDPIEDFRWHSEFDQFIDFLLAESGTNTDLVIAGDFLELWQSRDGACDHPGLSKNIACNEQEALRRTIRVTEQHNALIESLNKFLGGRGNTVIIIAGNHDAALLYPSVSDHVAGKFNASTASIYIPASAYWVNEDGKIYVEHGQQRISDVNMFDDWPAPFQTWENEAYLEKTWGEQFVQKFFNHVEDDLPLIDNISSELDGFIEGFNHSNWEERYDALRNGVLFFIKHMSFSQAVQSLEQPPVGPIDPNKVRAYEGESFFYKSIPNDSPLYEPTKKLVTDGGFKDQLATLSIDEIVSICGYRSSVYLEQQKKGQLITLQPCLEAPPENLRAIVHGTLVSRSAELGSHISRIEEGLVLADKSSGIDTYIFGHTHKYERRYLVRHDGKRYRVLNTGAWQRVIGFEQLKELASNTPGAEGPFSLTLEALPACYTFVSVPPYTTGSRPSPVLRKWGADCGRWGNDIPMDR